MNYINDVIIFAQSEKQRDIVVKEVLNIFRENNVLLNNDKYIWKTNKLTFLGHILSSEGVVGKWVSLYPIWQIIQTH